MKFINFAKPFFLAAGMIFSVIARIFGDLEGVSFFLLLLLFHIFSLPAFLYRKTLYENLYFGVGLGGVRERLEAIRRENRRKFYSLLFLESMAAISMFFIGAALVMAPFAMKGI